MATAPFAASKCSLFQARIDGDLDLNGRELGKALKPLLKGNAVIIEWLRSPVIYRGDAQFREEFLAFATQYANRDLVGRHYLHLGERQRRTYFGCGRAVPQKKIFYALRPAAALRWLRFHPDQAVAPMHFATLMDESDPPREVIDVISDLMERKAMSRELGTAPLPESIANFIDTSSIKAEFNSRGRPSGYRMMRNAKRVHSFERLQYALTRAWKIEASIQWICQMSLISQNCRKSLNISYPRRLTGSILSAATIGIVDLAPVLI